MTAPDADRARVAPGRCRERRVRRVRPSCPTSVAWSWRFVVVGIVIAVLGHDPVEAFRAVLTNSFRTGGHRPRRCTSGCR